MTICKNFLCNLQKNFERKKTTAKGVSVSFICTSFAIYTEQIDDMVSFGNARRGDCAGELSICQKNLVVSKKELEFKSLVLLVRQL